MNQGQTVHAINQLLPEINRTRSPDTVLRKYASENNLSPAQLERMGQMYNTAKTVSYMEKSASRGGSFALLDVEAMVNSYMELDSPAPLEKSASAGIQRAAKPFDLPRVWDYFDKKATTATPIPDPVAQGFMNKIAAEKEDQEFQEDMDFYEGLIYLKQTLFDDIHQGIDKLATAIYDQGPETFSALQRDSRSSPWYNENALEYIAQHMDKAYRGSYTRESLTKLASIRVTKDTTGLLEDLSKLEEDIQIYDETRSLMLEKIAAREKPDPDADPFAALEGVKTKKEGPKKEKSEMEKAMEGEGAETTSGPAGGEKAPAPDEDESQDSADKEVADEFNQFPGETQNTGGTDTFNADMGAGREQAFDDEIEKQNLKQQGRSLSHDQLIARLKLVADGNKPNNKPGEKTPTNPRLDAATAAFDRGHETVKGVVDPAFKSTTDWLRSKLNKTPTHNTGAFRRDAVRGDVSRSAILQRAIMGDEVLSGADPRRVASLYNTLYNANPEMMSDPNVMSAALREAVQYDGVMPHTYEQFVGTAKTRADEEAKSMQTRSNKYTI